MTLIDSLALPPVANGLPQCTGGMAPPACFDYTPYYVSVEGRHNSYAPVWTLSAGLQYAIPLPSESTLTPRIDYSFQGSQWSTLIENPASDYLARHDIWNFRLTYDHTNWSFVGYVTNMLDKTYVSGSFGTTEFFGSPREFELV